MVNSLFTEREIIYCLYVYLAIGSVRVIFMLSIQHIHTLTIQYNTEQQYNANNL
nr:MAG TPA: hypothetical protein [Caudoviricetes sp.]